MACTMDEPNVLIVTQQRPVPTRARRRHNFQGQFGMNDTELTIAIEFGNFEEAKTIIQDATDPQLLNDGPGADIPLHLVLNTFNKRNKDHIRNLNLAKLLVEKGANPNLRITVDDFYQATQSPFQELVVYYELLRSFLGTNFEVLCNELEYEFDTEEEKIDFITSTIDLNDVQCISKRSDCKKLMQHTRCLIDIFIEHGADPNVVTTFDLKTLFHWVVLHEDVELAKSFLSTGKVNFNLCDVHGNSPLMDSILRNEPSSSLSLYRAMLETAESIDVYPRNCSGETTLFRAVFMGALEVVAKICENTTCHIPNKVSLLPVPMLYHHECRVCSDTLVAFHVSHLKTPLLAPLLADSPSRLRYSVSSSPSLSMVIPPHKHLIDKVIGSSLSPLIDLGIFNTQFAMNEINYLLACCNFNNIGDGRVHSSNLLPLMFGQTSAGLRQLCVRSIFDHVFMNPPLSNKVWPRICPPGLRIRDCNGYFNQNKVIELTELLKLPISFSIFFEIEAAKYKVCKVIMLHESVKCDQFCSASDTDESFFDDDNESFRSSEESNGYADSLMFFSSEMLSEESSEEVNDLSEEEGLLGTGILPESEEFVTCEFSAVPEQNVTINLLNGDPSEEIENICLVEVLYEAATENIP